MLSTKESILVFADWREIAREALVLFRGMLEDDCGVKPTDTTMVCILSTAFQLGVLETGACVHGYIEKTIPFSKMMCLLARVLSICTQNVDILTVL
ncbi:hypothetical protein FEM48_Zijuj01G0075700 [Ziziphus jujuba var. spinosa]|uniref:Pentatricopeptide repeat-containing protein n=1 Tax=Ziziphus jujuba var. spinosa TaxID=714518 RepID=A0A978VZY5_ZIZJJ|nr:hypothetical protein FEM48_Zijuj01G0075700 [Ziziphus jujuba var. spinosa]